jgi:hypothetical protein
MQTDIDTTIIDFPAPRSTEGEGEFVPVFAELSRQWAAAAPAEVARPAGADVIPFKPKRRGEPSKARLIALLDELGARLGLDFSHLPGAEG